MLLMCGGTEEELYAEFDFIKQLLCIALYYKVMCCQNRCLYTSYGRLFVF